jgi:hypothetical protein
MFHTIIYVYVYIWAGPDEPAQSTKKKHGPGTTRPKIF